MVGLFNVISRDRRTTGVFYDSDYRDCLGICRTGGDVPRPVHNIGGGRLRARSRQEHGREPLAKSLHPSVRNFAACNP